MYRIARRKRRKREQTTFTCMGLILAVGVLLAIGAPTHGQGNELNDQAISDAVEDELTYDQGVNPNQIDIATTDGVVTLSGTVDHLLAKQRAARIATTVKGVRSVVSRLSVNPPEARSDQRIKSDVIAALVSDPATESYELSVEVNDGNVTLDGTVDSWQERQLAETVAKGVAGVTGITNDITVQPAENRSDNEIASDIRRALHWDAFVDNALIDVDVNDGQVILSGTVGSAAEKNRAELLAYVHGVTSVTSGDLEVARWARDPELRKDKYVVKSDEAIQQAIEDALLYDPRVFSFNITPEVTNGVVTLRGTVDNLKAKRAAAQDARNTVGVIGDIQNRIKVRTQTEREDTEIRQDVQAAFLRDPYVESFEVDITVRNGTVRLSGVVDTYYEKGQADDIASRVEGVTDVRNNLTVASDEDPLVYDPYADPDWTMYDYDWYDYQPSYTAVDDSEIKEEINDEMWWSPFVDSDEVTVEVENGYATLTGRVDSWAERRAATENAFEGGAVAVDNDLLVTDEE